MRLSPGLAPSPRKAAGRSGSRASLRLTIPYFSESDSCVNYGCPTRSRALASTPVGRYAYRKGTPMPKPSPIRHLVAFFSLITCLSLFAPALTMAATVANGDFEAGNLSGWKVDNLNDHTTGGWLAYSGSSVLPPEPEPFTSPAAVPQPPQGTFGATTASNGCCGRYILYQDVSLEPYYTHQLSLVAYYTTEAEIVAPNTLDPLDPEGTPNQQYRIDVMRPSAPLDSLNPADILATVFATKTGDPNKMSATTFGADLTPFAGQTVRLRMVEVDNQYYFHAGVDAVSITSTPPSNLFTLGKPKRKGFHYGTLKQPVTVAGPGTLSLTGKGVHAVRPNGKVKPPRVTGAGTYNLLVSPKGKTRRELQDSGRAKVRITITYTPTGGTPNSKNKTLVLKTRLR